MTWESLVQSILFHRALLTHSKLSPMEKRLHILKNCTEDFSQGGLCKIWCSFYIFNLNFISRQLLLYIVVYNTETFIQSSLRKKSSLQFLECVKFCIIYNIEVQQHGYNNCPFLLFKLKLHIHKECENFTQSSLGKSLRTIL